MKNSLNQIKINLGPNEYRPIEQGYYLQNNKINMKDFIANNYSSFSNNLYNINNFYNNGDFYSSLNLSINNHLLGKNNYRDLLNMSLENKKIVVNKLGLSKKKVEKKNNSGIIEDKIDDEKLFNNMINEKKINFNKNKRKLCQITYFNKNNNCFNTGNNTPMFNNINNNKMNNQQIVYSHNTNSSFENKSRKIENFKSSYLGNKYSIDNFSYKIFQNVFNKFIKYLNNYCHIYYKNDFINFFLLLKLKKKVKKIPNTKLYNNHFNNKFRLLKRNIKSLIFDDSFKTNDISTSIGITNNMSKDKILFPKDINSKTITFDSIDFEKNKKYHQYIINNNSLINSNNINFDNDKGNTVFTNKIYKINPFYRTMLKPLNIKYQKKKVKSLNKSKEADKIVYSKKIIHIKPKLKIKNNEHQSKNDDLSLIHKYSTDHILSGKMNNMKKLKKDYFNSFLKNKVKKKDKKILNINNIKNKLKSNNTIINILKTSNSFYHMKETKKINKLNNNKKGKEKDISLNYINYLCPREIKKLFFIKLKKYCNNNKNYTKTININNNFNKRYSLVKVTTCGTKKFKKKESKKYN